MLIKCKFLKDGKPSGRDYSYRTPEVVKVGDMVQINDSAKGIVTVVDVSESEIADFADQIKTIIGKVEPRMVMRNWRMVNVLSKVTQAPELLPKYLNGNTYGNPEFEDGKEVTTSPVVNIVDEDGCKIVVTVTGSRYVICPQDVNPEAEKKYPGYYERLKIR